jgi:Flp pilus assembly protein TadG
VKHDREAGIVTAETALVIPTLMLVMALAATVVMTLMAKVQVLDASRAAARTAARGDSDAEALAAAQRLGPDGASVRLVDRSEWVEAVVSAKIRPFGLLPAFTVTASTLAAREQP